VPPVWPWKVCHWDGPGIAGDMHELLGRHVFHEFWRPRSGQLQLMPARDILLAEREHGLLELQHRGVLHREGQRVPGLHSRIIR